MALWFPSTSVLLIGQTALLFRISTNLKNHDRSPILGRFSKQWQRHFVFLDLDSRQHLVVEKSRFHAMCMLARICRKSSSLTTPGLPAAACLTAACLTA